RFVDERLTEIPPGRLPEEDEELLVERLVEPVGPGQVLLGLGGQRISAFCHGVERTPRRRMHHQEGHQRPGQERRGPPQDAGHRVLEDPNSPRGGALLLGGCGRESRGLSRNALRGSDRRSASPRPGRLPCAPWRACPGHGRSVAGRTAVNVTLLGTGCPPPNPARRGPATLVRSGE